ncbi:MAG: ABC transporter ATP-binding protein [Clostridia bacterium]|nr:ABC transporter ATP-binding protein [Clostridia bacterium]
MSDTIIKVENVSKEYRLGAIGGATLVGELQSWWARVRGKEDPNSKIGAKSVKVGEKFLALDGISFEVKKGERVGIIGHNGAGKSTFLKLLSRVTAPTKGTISYNGRISSMLEVGTGFHPELTGRENVYMNGAILGMTKKEIDSKFDDIVKFAEMEQFIDTPVKRYSSGMYVKLAFAVAAHLDSEIMIMDEVLAVGDINFQQKCLAKMKEVGTEQGRTILYVSHNMNTIRQLCTRCIVLDHGKMIFDGDIEEAISLYTMQNTKNVRIDNDLAAVKRPSDLSKNLFMEKLSVTQCSNGHLKFRLNFNAKKTFSSAVLRLVLFDATDNTLCTSHSDIIPNVKLGSNSVLFDLNISCLMNGLYRADLILSDFDENMLQRHDLAVRAFRFEITDNEQVPYNLKWSTNSWGKIQLDNMQVVLE